MKQRLNLIIPMAGKGKRFCKAGYQTYKPFIPIFGKPMIQYVTEAFPREVRRFVITTRSFLSQDQIHYLEKDLHCEIIDIPEHDEGPAWSIQQAKEKLPLEESFFIAYCDIYWKWDFEEVMRHLDQDGVIYTHSGFHPHLIQNDFSAFCRPQESNSNFLEEIREKGSFTKDWMQEPLSVGVFYVKNGHDMMAGIEYHVQNNIRVAGEFFPSLLFNPLAQKEKRIFLQQIPFYIHWGVPAHLQDYERWGQIITQDKKHAPATQRNGGENVMIMGGIGKRMQEVSNSPKALIPINGHCMFEHVLQRFPSATATLVTTPSIAKMIDKMKISARLFVLDRQTQSQYETVLLSRDLLKKGRRFFITSCDAYGLFDREIFQSFVNTANPDAVIFTFSPSLTHRKMSGHHSHVSVDGQRVTAVHIKSKIAETDLGFAGFFWVRDGRIFDGMENIPKDEKREMCIDHIFKYFVEQGLHLARFDMDQYVHLGTSEEFLEYDYWNKAISCSSLL